MATDHYPHAQFAAMRNQQNMAAIIASTQQSYPAALLADETRVEIATYSPGIRLLDRLKTQKIGFHDLSWREFERVIGEMLEAENFEIKMGKGSKDGGIDIFAYKDVPQLGPVFAAWQAKTTSRGNKVGLTTVKELAWTAHALNATKAVIATNYYLTSGALDLVEQRKYQMNKVDLDDLRAWIRRLAEE